MPPEAVKSIEPSLNPLQLISNAEMVVDIWVGSVIVINSWSKMLLDKESFKSILKLPANKPEKKNWLLDPNELASWT